MQTTVTKYVVRSVIICVFLLVVMITTHGASMPVVFAQDKEPPPDIQADILINSAKNDMEAERWKDAAISFEKAMNLRINLPVEFHLLYGKVLLKAGNYDDALSSISNYLTLVGREGEYFEDAITLIVEAKNKFDEEKLRTTKSQHQLTKTARQAEDGMVFVKGGCFDMGDIFNTGDSDEKPVHTVCVDNFYLGRTEVTQKQWVDITGHNPSKFQCEDCPVERVSWNDITDFIKKLNERTGMNYRLPTEAEWEYAARSGGLKEQWVGANNVEKIGEYAWYGLNAEGSTHAVAGKLPNAIGLYDMMGNVWEWCSDWYDKHYYKIHPSKDPHGHSEDTNHVLRGGGWRSKDNGLRTTDRNSFDPTSRKFSDIGFRLARSQ
jgi:formylglycine-generating enzyme required for sulfatase activity